MLDRVGCQGSAPAALPLRTGTTHYTGVWVGLWAALNGCGKSRREPGFDPRTVHLLVSEHVVCITKQLVVNDLDLRWYNG